MLRGVLNLAGKKSPYPTLIPQDGFSLIVSYLPKKESHQVSRYPSSYTLSKKHPEKF